MTLEPFIQGAKVETMQRDFSELREAIRAHDSFAAETAWERCERWLGAVKPETSTERPDVD